MILVSPNVASLMAAYDASPSPELLRILADAMDEAGGDGAKCRTLADWQEKAKALSIPDEGSSNIWVAKDKLRKAHGLPACHLWACLCVRYCPLADGRRAVDLLTDERYRLVLSGTELDWLGLLSEREINIRRRAYAVGASFAADVAYAAYAVASSTDSAYAVAYVVAYAADAGRCWAARLAALIQEGWQP